LGDSNDMVCGHAVKLYDPESIASKKNKYGMKHKNTHFGGTVREEYICPMYLRYILVKRQHKDL
jgi:hypothetical protein